MLTDMSWRFDLDERDWKFYDQLLPQEHPLLDAVEKIDWDAFIPGLEAYYCRGKGQPAFPPLLMLKFSVAYQIRVCYANSVDAWELKGLPRCSIA